MKLLKISQTAKDEFNRLVATLWNGKSSTVTAVQYSSFGDDSNPIKDSVGVYAETEMIGKEVLIGIMNKNSKTEIGEKRGFATDENGNVVFNWWLRADGTMLIGDSETPSEYTNYAVKYNEAKQEIDKLKASLNSLIQKWNAFCSVYVPGSPSTTGLPPTLASSTVTANNSDFSLLKHENLKYNE